MYIKELTHSEFEEFANNHPLSNFHQTINYALLKSEHEYEYEMIGYFDNNDNIIAAALILVKLIDGYCYAYVPEGYLIDYKNEKLLNSFTENLIKYYKKERISFIKINPRIVVSTINNKTHERKYNDNSRIISLLNNAGYTKLDDNEHFESILPKINPVIDLENYSFDKLSKNTKNKIRKAERKGLTIELGNQDQLPILDSFVKKKIKRNEFYYNDYFSIFKRNDKIDLFLVKIDYNKYITNSTKAYEKETKKNEFLNTKLLNNARTKNINKKINSDKTLLCYKADVSKASKYLNENHNDYIAGALVVTHNDTATIIISGYDKNYSDYVPNYFLYNEIINYYKDNYKFLDLNGITGDFGKDNKYYGLNEFKLGFNPQIYEYIGEFDLIINKSNYNYLLRKGLLKKEFTNEYKKQD